MWLNWNFGWKSQKLNFSLLKNWTFLHMTRRIEFFFSIWLKELNPVWNMIQRINCFLNLDSKNWTFYYLTQRVELFSYLTHCIELFSCLPQRIHWVTLENKKGSILWVISEKKVESSESYWRISILRVVFKKKSSMSKKKSHVQKKNKFNSVSRILFFFWKKKLWVMFKKGFNSASNLSNGFNSFRHNEKRVQFFESDEKNFNYLSHFWKKTQKKINSLSHIFLEMVWFFEFFRSRFKQFFSTEVQFFGSYSKKFNSLSLFQKKKNAHFLESISKEKFNSLSHTGKQDRFDSLSHIEKKTSTLWVTLRRGS